jgi:hypothetical protein
LANRTKLNLEPQDDFDKAARAAVHAEEVGELSQAKGIWLELLLHKKGYDPEYRGWGLLVRKHLRKLLTAEKHRTTLKQKPASETTIDAKDTKKED